MLSVHLVVSHFVRCSVIFGCPYFNSGRLFCRLNETIFWFGFKTSVGKIVGENQCQPLTTTQLKVVSHQIYLISIQVQFFNANDRSPKYFLKSEQERMKFAHGQE